MKLLHVISSINPKAGGVSQAVVTMIGQLKEYGVSSEVVTVDSGDEVFLNETDFEVHALGPGKTGWGYSMHLQQWLNTHLQQYDTIVVHGLWQYQSLAVYSALVSIQGKRPRLLVMPHGMLDPYFQKAKERRVKAIRNYIIWHTIEHQLINIADGLLFTCEEEKLLARQTFKRYRPAKEIVVGLGVDAPPSYVEDMRKAFEAKLGAAISNYWLFISRIHEKKGVDLLIRAYLVLKKQGLTLPKLVIAGPGLDTAYGKTIFAMAGEDADIYFPGMLTGDAKWGAFYGADLFILPSHQENFGIAVVEALACGIPVIVSNKVNIWREIAGSRAGIIIADTEAALLEALQAARDGLGISPDNCKQAYIKHFSTTVTSDKLYKAIAS
jgi:glycosyltransferase involved in cell wall biosynthesis